MDIRNNKERLPLEHYAALFREVEPAEVERRTGARFDGGAFALNLMGQGLRAEYPEFRLTAADGDCPEPLLGVAAQILVSRYLTGGKRAPWNGRFLSYRELPWGEVYDRNFQGRCVSRLARTYGKNADTLAAFRAACLKLCGTPAKSVGGAAVTFGDAAYDLPFTDGMTVRFIVWTGDDEFPPSAQILFSDNTHAAFDAEDLAAVGEVMLAALKSVG
ncbi:MAG: DUF3786 domain-containing protein [Oscillospiraceae bacterium]|jgi:hypothetical protein|nr:DUF3786 domain-containing protein [Oscillospiraceae bacterium]